MGTGYQRADTGNQINNGNVIDADFLDLEFDAIQSAFNSTTGHTHDGTSSEGAPITFLGPNQEVEITATDVAPATTDAIDLGTNTFRFKDAYLSGGVVTAGDSTLAGPVTVSDGFYVAGVKAATVAAAGTTVPAATDVITREKGDVRYLGANATGPVQLSGTFTHTGNSFTVNNGLTITTAPSSNNIRLASNYVFQSQNIFRSAHLDMREGLVDLYACSSYSNISTYRSGISGVSLTNDSVRLVANDSVYFTAPGTTSDFASSVGNLPNFAYTTIFAQVVRNGSSVRYTNSQDIPTKGIADASYQAASSSLRYKDDATEAATGISVEDLGPLCRWTWGGELSGDDALRGRSGYGLIAENVVEVFPEAAVYDREGKLSGLQSLPLIGLLVKEVRELKSELAKVKAQLSEKV